MELVASPIIDQMIVDTTSTNFLSWLTVTTCESVVLLTIPCPCWKRTDVLTGLFDQEVLRDGNWPTSIWKPIYCHVLREWVKQTYRVFY